MKTTALHLRLLVYGVLLFSWSLAAAIEPVLNYQGRASVGDVVFEGTGHFKFALVDSTGATSHWSNDGSSAAGSEPADAVALSVVRGLYSVRLGDTSLDNMTALPPDVFSADDLRLRVWFNDGVHGFQQLSPDQRLSAAPYAMRAAIADEAAAVAEGAIGASQLDPAFAAGLATLDSSPTFTGAIAASAFSGDGAGLTGLDASNISSGTLPLARLPSNVLTDGATGVTLSGTFSGSGAGLNSVNAILLNGLSSTAFGRLGTANTWAGANVFNANTGFFSANPQARVEIQAGADNAGGSDQKAMAFAYHTGGYRHWIRTRHNGAGAASGNAIDFFVNTSSTAAGSSGPGTGSLLTLTLDNGKVGIGKATPATALDVVGSVTATGTFFGDGSGLTGLTAAQIPNLDASKINSGTLDAARISSLDASKIGSGALDVARIPSLDASKIGSGTLSLDRLPSEVLTDTATGVTLSGSFSGDGSGLMNVPFASPWQTISGTAQTAEPNRSYLLTNDSHTTLTMPTSAAVGDIVTVSGAGAEGWTVSASPVSSLVGGVLGPPGEVWTTALPIQGVWEAVASSADGTKLVAGMLQGQLYTSTDSGVTWTARESHRYWRSVASSADGSKLVAVDTLINTLLGQIYTSTDSGVTWTPRESNRNWASVASSADGGKLVAAVSGGHIYTSTDSGVTWTPRESALAWSGVASSADGSKLVAVASFGHIYTSTDSGVTWTPRGSSRNWRSVASSADGSRLVAVVSPGWIYTSTDSGVTWTARENDRHWQAVASSADGSKLVAVENGGQIYTSTDSGVTWTARESNRSWRSVASSADGNKLVAGVWNEHLYTSRALSSISGAAGTTLRLQYIGNGDWQPMGESQIGAGSVGDAQISGIDASKIVSGTIETARIPSLDAAKIATGTIDAARIPSLDAAKITTGTIDTARIPSLDAAKITTGTLDTAQIPNLDASKITAGTLDAARIPNLDASKIATGTIDLARLPSSVVTLNQANVTLGDSFTVNGEMRIPGSNTLEFGAGVAGKEDNAGKIGYQRWTEGLDIVGAGAASNRKISFFADGGSTFHGNVHIHGALTADNAAGLTNVPGTLPWQTVSGTSQQAASNTGYMAASASQLTVTLPSSPALGQVVRVSGAGAGGWKVAQNSGQSVVGNNLSGPSGLAWTSRGDGGGWSSIASSADGSKLVAVRNNEYIYTSTNSGETWTQRENSRNWASVASSSDGVKLVAAVSGGRIYTSTNSGETWSERANNQNWASVASSADGSKLVAVVSGGGIYTSADSGGNWTQRENSRNWISVASSKDGSRLVAVVAFGQIYTSTDSGVTWTARESNRNWRSVASSADGSRLVAAVVNGQIYTSADSGVTWTARESNRNWRSVASSANGGILAAVVAFGQIYTSTDFGETWTARETDRNWGAIASSADGTRFAAAVTGGQIYTSAPTQKDSTTAGVSGYLEGYQFAAIELQFIGDGQWMPISAIGTILAH